MWDLCNAAVYGADTKTRQIACRRKLAIELCHLHQQHNKAHCTDSESFIRSTPDELETYIATHNFHHIQNWFCISQAQLNHQL
jgi:hypothetical protein